MIIAINYADENFVKAQRFNTKSAYKKGKVDKVIEYSPDDIDNDFYTKNKKILREKRGGGYWLWKPYFIMKTLENSNDGDYIFYCDSGAYYIDKVKYLIDDLEKSNQSIMAFELPLIEKQWTKAELLKKMHCDYDEFKESNQAIGGYILIKVNDESKEFFRQYLKLCCNFDLINDEYIESDQLDSFIDHRHDQSIFSLLCKKYNLELFRDPSQYGVRPWEYMGSGREFNVKTYNNSNYPQIIVSQRTANLKSFIIKEFIKNKLTKLGFWNERIYTKKNNIEL